MSDKYTVEDAPAQSKYTVEDAASPAPQQSWWDRVTAPYTEIQKPDPNAPAFSGKEAIKAVGNIGAGGLGVILHPYNTLKSVGRMALETAPPVALAEKYLMHQNPSGEEMGQQFADNPYGTIEAGIGQAGAAPIFQGEVTAPIKAARIIPKIAKGGMDILAGTTPKVAADLATKTAEENAKITDANTKATQKHLEDTQDALHQTRGNELEYQRKLAESKREAEAQAQSNLKQQIADREKAIQERKDAEAKLAAQKAQQEKIAPTQNKLQTAWGNLRAGIETARAKALQVGNGMYEEPKKALGPREAGREAVEKALTTAEQTLVGSETKLPVLDQLEKKLRNGKSNLTFGDVQGFYSELGSELSKGSLLGDVYKAYDKLHESLGQEMKTIALEYDRDHGFDPTFERKSPTDEYPQGEVEAVPHPEGMAAKLDAARNYWRRMKQAFGKQLSQPDAATKALRTSAPDVAEAADQANRVRLLGSFDPDIPAQFNHVSNIQQGIESLPEPVSPRQLERGVKAPTIPPRKVTAAVEPKPVPLPDRVAPPDRPNLTEMKKVNLKDLREAKTAVLRGEKGAPGGKLGHLAGGAGTWHLISSAMYGNPVGMVTGGAVAASPGLFARVLKSPPVIRLLAEPTPADIAAIPPEIRGDLPAIVDAAQKQGIKVHPSILLMARPNAPQQ